MRPGGKAFFCASSLNDCISICALDAILGVSSLDVKFHGPCLNWKRQFSWRSKSLAKNPVLTCTKEKTCTRVTVVVVVVAVVFLLTKA